MRRLRSIVVWTGPPGRLGLRLPALILTLAVLGCAQQQPVVYPRAGAPHGSAQAQQVVAACMARAEAYGLDYNGGAIARRTVEGAIVGGAGGAVAGAIYDNWSQGALAGVASGATVGLLRGLFAADVPAPAYQRFVARCLAERGYEVIGWQ